MLRVDRSSRSGWVWLVRRAVAAVRALLVVMWLTTMEVTLYGS